MLNFGRIQRTLTSKNDYRVVEKIRDGQNAWDRQNSETVDKILGHLFQVFLHENPVLNEKKVQIFNFIREKSSKNRWK